MSYCAKCHVCPGCQVQERCATLPLLKTQELLQNCNRIFLCQLLHGLTRPFKPLLGRIWAGWLFASKLICTELHSPSVEAFTGALTISLALSILSVVFSSSCRFGMSSPAVGFMPSYLCLCQLSFFLVNFSQTQFCIYRLVKVLAPTAVELAQILLFQVESQCSIHHA